MNPATNQNKLAFGVEYGKNGKLYRVKARREVIIPAGSNDSPKLLMLSGPKDQLKKHARQNVSTVYIRTNQSDNAAQMYTSNRDGIFSASDSQRKAYVRSNYALDKKLDISYSIRESISGSIFPNLIDDKYKSSSFNILNLLTRLSFSIQIEGATVIEGSEVLRCGLDAKPFPNTLPGCEKFPQESEEFFRCYFRTLIHSSYHPSGWCEMVLHDDLMVSVDPMLQARGIRNLRTMDPSIVPEITTGDTNAPTIMIGERAAHLHLSGMRNWH
ncbi:oxygen-dependent choline dehydrogenase-like [Brevipalpus obovatus]|uniref:oxygen-dependent choline dehydrogenase-like n=1 Tax=Brevipalpus obovatus TaxID=246614 RepID=UPI003D9F99D9